MRKTDLPEVYDNLAVAVCVIDQERRILYANRAFSELTGVLNKNAGEERFGAAFGCIHALEDPRGCGAGEMCAECPVSLAVEDTFATGKENRDVEQRFSLTRDGVRRDATVLASTTIVRIDNMDALLLCLQDITGRRNEEARYGAFYENSAIGFYRTTPAGEIVQANPALVRMLGYDSFEQLAERNLSSEGFALDYPRAEFAERLEREGTISGFESSWTRADGSRKWLQENAWLTRDADGRPLYYDGTVEDVTSLKETQDRYRQLYEDQQIITGIARMLAGVNVQTADVQFDRVLETVGEYLGVDRVHIVPLSGENAPEYRIREWCASGISPWSADNRSQVVDQCSWLMDRFDQEEPVQIPDISALPPDVASQLQTYLPHDARSLIYLPFPKNENDLAGCLHCEVVREPREWTPREVGLLRVIAETLMTSIIGLSASRRLRESEEKLRTVLENITDVVWSLSFPEFEPLFISPSAEELYGLSVEVFYNAPMEWQELIHPEDRHTTESAFADLEANGYAERECRIVRPDGEIRWVRDRSHFVFDEAGDRVAITGIASDITERKTAQHKLEQTAWALRQRLKERDALAAVWKSWQERQSLDEFLQVAVGEIPAGFQQPSVISARITFGEQQFVSPRFFESSRMLSEDVRVNGERAGTVTVYAADEIAPFLEEEAALVKAIADHIGRAAENYRILGDLRLQSAALETAGSGIIICDARDSDLPTTYVNPGFERLSGYSEAEFIGRNPRFLQGEDREQPGLTEIRAGIREHRECNAVVRNFSKNGMPFWIDLRITPVRNDDGVVTHYVGISSDVTDLIEMRQELLQNERRLRLSQEYAGIGTWDWEISTGNLFWSAEIARMLGFTQDFRAATYESFRQAVHPEDREAFEDAIAECLKTGKRYVKEFRCIRADGTVIWLLGAGNVTYDASGRPDHLLGIGQDITERKQRETEILRQQQFQKVLADSAADFINADIENLDTLLNRTLQRIGDYFGADRSDIFLLSSDQSIVSNTHEWCGPNVASKMSGWENFPVEEAPWYTAQIFELGVPVRIPDVEQMPKEAAHEQALLQHLGVRAAVSIPLRSRGRVLGMLGLDLEFVYAWTDSDIRGLSVIAQIVADSLSRVDTINELIELKAESDAARQQSEAANRAKSEFLSSMSHELRTPLNAILGFSQLLREDEDLTAQQRDSAAEVVRAGDHLLSLVNEVLDLARIESGRVDLSIEPVSCAGVLSESAKMIEPFADKYGIRLEIGEAGGLTMQADAIRVKQVLVNLLSNAVKYNRPGGSVAVACSRRDNTIRISVTDTGEGIPEEKIGELFTQFNRLGRESGDIEGTGIGLAHSKRLVELMAGSIGVESVYGTGSTFWIELPASEETGDGVGSPFGAGSRGEDLGESEDTRKQITVLYIEDNPAAVRLMEQMLITRARYRLVTAHSGSLGVDIAEVEHPGVMLVDINLPGIDGYEVLRRVRASEWGREIPVIAVSANAMDHAVKRGENAGFTAYVTKPFDIANFLATLDEVTAGLSEG